MGGLPHRKCRKAQQECVTQGPALLSRLPPSLCSPIGNSFPLVGRERQRGVEDAWEDEEDRKEREKGREKSEERRSGE